MAATAKAVAHAKSKEGWPLALDMIVLRVSVVVLETVSVLLVVVGVLVVVVDSVTVDVVVVQMSGKPST